MASRPRTRQRILDGIVDTPGGATRQELATSTKLSRPTVQKAVEELLGSEVIREVSSTATTRVGRPGRRLVENRPPGIVIGVDRGHTHLTVVVSDESMRELARKERTSEPRLESGPAILKDVAAVIDATLAEASDRVQAGDVRAIVLGLPSAMSGARVLSPPLLGSWGGVDVDVELRKLLKHQQDGWSDDLIIRVENDANLGALGEREAAARGCDSFLYAKVSSGIGLGVVRNGQLDTGAHGIAGEFGHTSVSAEAESFMQLRDIASASGAAAADIGGPSRRPSDLSPPAQRCPSCGKLLCLQNAASCRAVLTQLHALGGSYAELRTIQAVIEAATKQRVDLPLCGLAMRNAGTRLGYALADAVRLFDPERVVIGGLMAQAKHLIEDSLQAAWPTPGPDAAVADLVFAEVVEGHTRSEIRGAVALASSLAADQAHLQAVA